MVYCKLYKEQKQENDECIVSRRCLTCVESEEVKEYCTKSIQNCRDCSMSNYNKDCENNDI